MDKNMDKESKYEKMYRAMMEYEDRTHLRNKHRIRVGIACLVFVPVFFLILMFLTDSSKPLFLMLWIISLYGIAVFLILVEYADHKLQQRLAQFRGEEEVEVRSLIGQHMENMEETLRNVKDKAEHFLMLGAGEEPAETKEAEEEQEIGEVLDLNVIMPDVEETNLPEELSEKQDLPEKAEERADTPEDLPEKAEEKANTPENLPEKAEEKADLPEESPEEEAVEQSEETAEEVTDEKHS